MDLDLLEAAKYSAVECGSEEGSKMEREGSEWNGGYSHRFLDLQLMESLLPFCGI
jgi:hypothetical protein